MIDRATSWKCDTSLKFICFNESSIGILNGLTDINKFHAWSDDLLCVSADLSVALGSLTQDVIVRLEESLLLTELSISDAASVVVGVGVFLNLIDGELTVWVLLDYWNSGWGGLLPLSTWRCWLPRTQTSEH